MNLFWLGLLFLTWRIFRSIEGAKDGCPAPPAAEFAESFAESYQVGTRVKYKCDTGYKRQSGQSQTIKCSSDQKGFGQWTSVVCIEDPRVPLRPSALPTKRTEESGKTDGPLTKAQPLMKGFCGVLRPPEHVKAVSVSYTVGQELQYQCMDGYRAGSPISEKITCQNFCGKTVWSKLHLRCTNDTMSIEEDISRETGMSDVPSCTTVTPLKTVSGRHSVILDSAPVLHSDIRNSAPVIYASAVFAVPLMAMAVIL